MSRSPLKWTLALLLGTSVGFSTGCGNPRPPVTPDTSWVKPIRFHPETLAWLEGLEWPETAYEDFDQIAKHNEKVQRINAARSQAK